MKGMRQDSLSPGRALSPGSPSYEAGVLKYFTTTFVLENIFRS